MRTECSDNRNSIKYEKTINQYTFGTKIHIFLVNRSKLQYI